MPVFDSLTQGTSPEPDEQVTSEFVTSLLCQGSIELSANGEAAIRNGAEVLPTGMRVYIPKTSKQTLSDKLVQIGLLHDCGLDPVPHVVARQISSEQEIRDFLTEAISVGKVNRVLLIGGDKDSAVGPFTDAAAVLASGILSDVGLCSVDVAGYPDGHPKISNENLGTDLALKIRHASDQDLDLSIVTQFSFSPEKVAEYCQGLAKTAPGVAVLAGLAGPTSPAKLLRFAHLCGVGTSLRAAHKLGLNALKLAVHSSPDEHFDVLAEKKWQNEAGNLAGVHIFSFGGFIDSCEWLDSRARQAGLVS
jgi:methylenetetrahydrofolate reductase (NADPH)